MQRQGWLSGRRQVPVCPQGDSYSLQVDRRESRVIMAVSSSSVGTCPPRSFLEPLLPHTRPTQGAFAVYVSRRFSGVESEAMTHGTSRFFAVFLKRTGRFSQDALVVDIDITIIDLPRGSPDSSSSSVSVGRRLLCLPVSHRAVISAVHLLSHCIVS